MRDFMPEISHQKGRPFAKDEDRRSRNIQIRVTENVYENLKKLAEKNGISISTYGRVIVEEAIDRDRDRERLGEYDEY